MSSEQRDGRRAGLLAAAFLLTGPLAAQTSYTPLSDMGPQTYLGFTGGLYENGTNIVPADHATAGLARAATVTPLDAGGTPSAAGKIVLLSLGMSNTTQEYCSQNGLTPCNSWSFVGQATADPAVNHTTLFLVNGARGGQTASQWDSPMDPNYNRVRDTDLANAGATEAQVQVAWVKVANSNPISSLPAANSDAYTLEMQMGNIVRALRTRYSNLRLVFLSSRIYAGYATTTLNPEPYAYESGFAVKWLIQAQIDQMRNGGTIVDARAGDLNTNTGAPWIGWSAYLWANGTTPRSDGLMWVPADFEGDGTHPAQSGEQKVGGLLLSFFKSDPVSRPWFLSSGGGASLHTVSPCRILDTRGPPGPFGGPALSANTDRTFIVRAQCGIPTSARAVAVNLTVTGATAAGDLRAYPGGTPLPTISSINYSVGRSRANNAVLLLGAAGDIAIRCVQASGTVHFLLDVVGYFE